MRLAAYAGVSVALAAGVVLKALHQRANFYSACVYLSQSSANLMILTNLCLLVTGYLLFWLQRLLYGPLRPIETEQLYEKAWFAITETCLAMTIFRGELGGWFLVMFVCLLVGKVWGWIGEGRVEFLEQQPPSNPRLFHSRLAISLILSVLFDTFMLEHCIKTVFQQARPDMMVMFGFEFAVLVILSCSTAVRYAIALVEIYITRQQLKTKMEERRAEIRADREAAIREHQESGGSGHPPNLPDENDVDEMEIDVPGWEEKGRWVFYLDLMTDFLKLAVYLAFFAILFTFYGLPIHILRDVVITIRSFGRRIMDFVRYRNATRDMNERYPDATIEDMRNDDVCIICREQMIPVDSPAGVNGAAPPARPRVPDRLRPKKLPCGHVLHFSCLRSWLERQQNCPTCRRPVTMPPRDRVLPGQGVNDARDARQRNQRGGRNDNAPDGFPRARIYQFGPFRIGFGAGRPEAIQAFREQFREGTLPQPLNRRNIGVVRRELIPPTAPTTEPPSASAVNLESIQRQLQQIEQQITQEMDDLSVTIEQFHLVLLLQSELQRLRSLQENPATSTNPPGISSSLSSSIAMRRQFIPSPRDPPLRTGDIRLPDGLSLPPGWTLYPLSSTDLGAGGVTPSNQTPTSSETFPAGATAQHSPSSTAAENAHLGFSRDDNGSSQSLPNWGASPETLTRTVSQQTQSPFQDRVNTTHNTVSEKPGGPDAPSVAENNEQPVERGPQGDLSNNEELSTSSTKGKGRAATVEDAVDEERA